MAIALSIIVPVYNVRDYLAACIDSLLDQDLGNEEYEIILVDDGSTDDSGSICDEYAAREGRINQGLSAARNTGVSTASGEYIQFVDSDDYLEANVLKGLLSQIHRDNLDILRFNYENVNDSGGVVHPNKNPKLYSDYSSTVTDGKNFLLNRLGFACYACQFIVRRDLMIQFPFTMGIHFEDTEWLTRILPSACRVSSINLVVYFYRIRVGSITKATQIGRIRKNIEDQIRLVGVFKTEGKGVPSPSWYDSMTSITVLSVLNIFPLTTHHQTRQAARKIRLINLSPCLYCSLVHYFQ